MRMTVSRNGLLVLLTAILTFNYVDRFALGMMLQDIKLDLGLTDTQLGLVSGIAFALFYSVLGIPIARWADRGNRVTIIALTTALWSAAVALCGAAGSFAQLMLIRIGVAVGEAGCLPPAHSLLADYFSRAERPRAVARYMLGLPIALVVSFLAAGWLNELYGWRATFVILGLPGLVLAALAKWLLNEPRQQVKTNVTPRAPQAGPGFREVCGLLWANVTLRHLLFCFSIWLFFGYGITQWSPAFFMRSHGLQTGELGTWFAAAYGLSGIVGVVLGGELASRYAGGNERLQLLACAAAFMVIPMLLAYAFIASNYYLAFAAIGLASLSSVVKGPIFATIQTIVPAHMRATSIALIYLFANLIGLGLGPLSAGALSDVLRPWYGEESLRYALVILCPGYAWAAWHLWRASKTVAKDLSLAESDAMRTTPITGVEGVVAVRARAAVDAIN